MSEPDLSTWADLWAETSHHLGNSDEARFIVEAASGRSGASWLITLSSSVPEGAALRVSEMVRRRLAGEPLQYIVGSWGFRTLNLKVDRRVLIPRPETEQVVEAALKVLRNVDSPFVADLGTGTGAIALSVAAENHDALVWATDISSDALEVATINRDRLASSAAERVQFHQGSWFNALPDELRGRLHMIVSNPPYIGEDERDELDSTVVDWEPAAALFGGQDGSDAVSFLIEHAREWLNPSGSLFVEVAPRQSDAARQLALNNGFSNATIGFDFTNRPRWIQAVV